MYEGYDTFHVKSPIEVYAKAPAQRTSIARLAFGDKIVVFDGRNGWFSSPDKPSPLISLTGGNLEGARLDAMVLFPAQIKQMATQWRVGTATIDDKDVIAVQGTSGNLPPVNLYFDETTGLLLRMTRFTDTAVGTVPTQTAFSDYRDVAGVKVPFRWVTTWTDNETITEFTEIQLNATIEAAKFARPAPAPPPKLQ
jgi:outer membrane lipoprotein-sorting protein